jgi:hypothetical protein
MTSTLILELHQAFENAKPAFIAAGVPPVATIDRWRGQTLAPGQFEYYPLPALFIGRSTSWSREGNCYNGDMTLSFHFETETTGEMGSIATGKEEALKYYDLVNQVRRVLDAFSSERVSSLERASDEEVDNGVTIYEILRYRCLYYETEPEQAEAEPEDVEELGAGLVSVMR